MVLNANPKAEAGAGPNVADSNGGEAASEDHERTPPSPDLEAELKALPPAEQLSHG